MRLKSIIFTLMVAGSVTTQADTLGKYASIAKSIPTMQLKADPKSQAWARSARSILAVTDEAIAESIDAMNTISKNNGRPLICMPESKPIDSTMVHTLLAELISKMAPDEASKNISAVVVSKLNTSFPCNQLARQSHGFPPITIRRKMRHVGRG
jgi:hypothetical protein